MPSLSIDIGERLSLENLHRSEAFPKQILRKVSLKGEIVEQLSTKFDDDEETLLKNSPFKYLAGEYVSYFSRLTNGTLVILTNFRLFVHFDEKQGFYNIPVNSIDSLECREMFYLHIYCKDGRFAKITFENSECCSAWLRLLSGASSPPTKLDNIFAFAFHAWCGDDEKSALSELGFKSDDVYYCKKPSSSSSSSSLSSSSFVYGGFVEESTKKTTTTIINGYRKNQTTATTNNVLASPSSSSTDFDAKLQCQNEFNRLEFDADHWRITGLNEEYKFCATYPKFWIVPSSCTDKDIETAGRYRSLRRVPAVIWRHRGNGAVLVRCSQPESGIFGWRSPEDEKLLQAILAASEKQSTTTTTRPNNNVSSSSCAAATIPNGDVCDQIANVGAKSMLILDARSYTAAWANRAKGGGYESTEYYAKCDIEFLGLANIHAIRYSFQKLRTLCWETPETSWFQNLDACQWIFHLQALLTSASRVVESLHVDGRNVVVHCSDGWDRTTQIVSLAKLLLDSHYRTMKGFKELIEREWLAFGHKFGERSGALTGDVNQRAPVFLQWLDCVHYLLLENPCAFEFNETYLIKLAQHTYSGLFGTFLCNSANEYLTNNVGARTYSIWSFLHPSNCQFRNLLYVSNRNRGVLMCRLQPRDLAQIWRPVYCPADDPSNLRRRDDKTYCSTTSLDAETVVGSASAAETLPSTTTKKLGRSLTTTTSLMRTRSYDDLNSSFSSTTTKICRSGSETFLSTTSFLTTPKPADETKEIVEETLNHLLFNVTKNLTTNSNSNFFTPNASSTPATSRKYVDEEEISPPSNNVSTSTTDLLNASPSKFCGQCNKLKTPDGSTNFDVNANHNFYYSTTTMAPTICVVTSSLTKKSWTAKKLSKSSLSPMDLIDVDGLTKVPDVAQQRIREIVLDYEKRLELMQNEINRLRTYAFNSRQTYLTAASNGANGGGFNASNRSRNCSNDTKSCGGGDFSEPCSFDSKCGGGNVSDTSWEAVEERDAQSSTLWVPDHSISRCMNCGVEFWAVKRKHHCRNCGKVFCNACTNYECPVPEEQLYEPVRVCHNCYAFLCAAQQKVAV